MDIVNDIESYKRKVENSNGAKILDKLFDSGEYQEINLFLRKGDDSSEVLCGYGNVSGLKVYIFVQNISGNYAAVCKSQAEKISRLYSLALKTGNPIIGVYNSYGAYLAEGNDVMKSYSEIIYTCNRMSGMIPQISIISGKCYGINAVIASISDVIITTKDSEFGIDIGGQYSSQGYYGKNGLSSIECGDLKEAIDKVRLVIKRLPKNNLSSVNKLDYDRPRINEDFDITSIQEIIENIFDSSSFIELNKNYGKHFRVGFATIYGISIGVVLSDSVRSKIIDEDSCKKVCKFIRLCDSYSLPIITFIDAEGVDSLREITSLNGTYIDSTTVKITLIKGKACGVVYTTFCGKGSADIVLSWPDSVISPLLPETAIEVFYHDNLKNDEINNNKKRKELTNHYIRNEAASIKAAKDGIIDDIIILKETRNKIFSSLNMILNKRQDYPNKKHSNV